MAALGTIGYGLPVTVAEAPAPVLLSVTEETLSLLRRPLVVNALVPRAAVVPYVLGWLPAVIVRAFGVTVSVAVRVPVLPVKTESPP